MQKSTKFRQPIDKSFEGKNLNYSLFTISTVYCRLVFYEGKNDMLDDIHGHFIFGRVFANYSEEPIQPIQAQIV